MSQIEELCHRRLDTWVVISFKKVRKELVKIEVSFSKREILREDNVRIKDGKLYLFILKSAVYYTGHSSRW